MTDLPTGEPTPDPAAPIPTDRDDVLAPLFDALESNVGRVVALLAPLVAIVVAGLAAKLQAWLGVDLDPAPLTALVVAAAGSVMSAAIAWLRGRSHFEVAAVQHALAPVQPPTPPLIPMVAGTIGAVPGPGDVQQRLESARTPDAFGAAGDLPLGGE